MLHTLVKSMTLLKNSAIFTPSKWDQYVSNSPCGIKFGQVHSTFFQSPLFNAPGWEEAL